MPSEEGMRGPGWSLVPRALCGARDKCVESRHVLIAGRMHCRA